MSTSKAIRSEQISADMNAEGHDVKNPTVDPASPSVKRERQLFDVLRQKISPEHRLDLPIISVNAIVEVSKSQPLMAALHVRNGVFRLESGRTRYIRNYIGAAYVIACCIRDSEMWLSCFIDEVKLRNFKKPPTEEKIKEGLLQHLFRYVFADDGTTTRNRAYQYAYGLQYWFDQGRSAEAVCKDVMKHGPEKLYRTAIKKNRLLDAAAELKASGREPEEVTHDDVLKEVIDECSGDDWRDYGHRELPPDDEEFVTDLEAVLREHEAHQAGLEKQPGEHCDNKNSTSLSSIDGSERDQFLLAEVRLSELMRILVDLEAGLSEVRVMLKSA